MTKDQHKQALAALKKINRITEQIKYQRDALRAAFEEVEGILESVQQGVDSVEQGIECISSGLDEMSSYL